MLMYLPDELCHSDGRLVAIKEMRMECCDWEQVLPRSDGACCFALRRSFAL
jgi:hypothetical protein